MGDVNDTPLEADDRVNPIQVEALWRIREELGPPLTPEEHQLLTALRTALRSG